MLNCVMYGMLMPTFLMLDIGLGSRVYSIQLIVSCLIGLVSAYIASDVNKKRWVFCHFKSIDISENGVVHIEGNKNDEMEVNTCPGGCLAQSHCRYDLMSMSLLFWDSSSAIQLPFSS